MSQRKLLSPLRAAHDVNMVTLDNYDDDTDLIQVTPEVFTEFIEQWAPADYQEGSITLTVNIDAMVSFLEQLGFTAVPE